MIKFRWETKFQKTQIGEIPRDWDLYLLSQLDIQVIDGDRGKNYPKQSEFLPRGYCLFLTAKNVTKEGFRFEETQFISKERDEKMGKGKLRRYDIILTTRGTVGNIAYYDDKVPYQNIRINSGMVIIRNNAKIDTEFLYHLFKSPALGMQIESVAYGTAQPQLNVGLIKEFKIIVPNPQDQRRISTVLSWFDDLIENKKRQNEILGKTAMAIFKNWFVDFEPFKDEEFVYSEELRREIPKGWNVKPTIYLIDYNPSYRLHKGAIYPFVEMKDVKTDSMTCSFQLKRFTGSGMKFQGGDTLMARITPSLEHGKTAYVWFINKNEFGFGSTEFFVLHPRYSYLKEFVYLLAKNEDFREAAINSMSGTSGRQRADVNSLKSFLIPIPPSPIFHDFHKLVTPLFEKIVTNQKQIIVLKRIRDTLLPKLVFGKLRVIEI